MSDEPMIVAPKVAWCARHWLPIENDASINSVWCLLRVVTRTLELDRFTERLPKGDDFPTEAINAELERVAPLCCYLGEEELALIRAEARGHMGQRRS